MATVAEWRKRGGPAAALKARQQPPAIVPRVVPAPQLLELDTLQRRVGSLERDRQHGVQAHTIAELALDRSNAQTADIERALSDAEVAREQGQRALGHAISATNVAAAARAQAAGLVPTVAVAQSTAASAQQQASQALEQLARIGVHVIGVHRVGRSLFVRYSNGTEDEVPLPDDRRLIAAAGTAIVSSNDEPTRGLSIATSGSHTIPPDVARVRVDATAGAVTVVVPAGRTTTVRVKKIDSSANAVTIDPADGTVEGLTTVALDSQWDAVDLAPDPADPSNWLIW